jgi:putative oxidoreductase
MLVAALLMMIAFLKAGRRQRKTHMSQRSEVIEGHTVTSSRGRTVALWMAQIALAAIFTLSGASKLAGAAQMVQLFDAIGIGQWFRYVTGLIEVGSAVLLLIPSLAFIGAVSLALTMVGAIFTHIFVVGGNPAGPMVLLTATMAVAWIRRKR